MNLAGVDLNLLVALDALLAERSVTAAARRVGLSQPAMSHALARLRHLFADPLLVRTRHGMAPTARAMELAPALAQALADIQRVLAEPPRFDPKTASRRFAIAASDYLELVLLPPLIERLARTAPGLDLVVQPGPMSLERLAEGSLDLVVRPAPPRVPHGFYTDDVLTESFVCVMRKDHPLARGKLTLDRYCSASHVLIAPGGSSSGFVDDALGRVGKSRRIGLVLAHFLGAPHVVAQSDLVVILGVEMARTFQKLLPLAIRTAPFELPPLVMSMVWHERQMHDPALVWLRAAVRATARARASRETAPTPARAASAPRSAPARAPRAERAIAPDRR